MSYEKAAEFYDALYEWKDYGTEADKIHDIVAERAPSAETLLDVACGTGKHLELLRKWYSVEGVDLEAGLLAVARDRLPGVPLHLGDMRTFNLGRQFDVVTCLFSAIGYMETPEDLVHALVNMAGHLAREGVMLVEPWLSPDRAEDRHLSAPLVASAPDFHVVRVNDLNIRGRLTVMRFHYLVARPGKVEHMVETHSPALYTADEYGAAFNAAGLDAELDSVGLMGRGLWIARHSSTGHGA
jgi:SAM-dependent methyltransferase